MPTKYLSLYLEMKEVHSNLFKDFSQIHQKYAKDQEKYQKEFNKTGKKVQEVIRIYEKQLCGKTDASTYSRFATNLSNKFWDQIKNDYPLIDFIGVELS